jgi:hypothetical protein
MQMHDRYLNGWKEIGCYLGRTVRTAQRWETQLGMPIHRPAAKRRTAVIAFTRELDTWLVGNRSRIDTFGSFDTTSTTTDFAALSAKLIHLQEEATQLALQIQRARGEAPQLLNTSSTELAGFFERAN